MSPLFPAWPLASTLLLAVVFGLKHALDADHLAAVSTIVTQRRGVARAAVVGASWGAGHLLALWMVALPVLLFRVQVPPSVEIGLESLVALVLVLIGVEALWNLWRGAHLHVHVHEHDGHQHWHPHFHAGAGAGHDPAGHASHAMRRPLLVGMLHGLAGSAALLILVVARTESIAGGLLYVLAFGVGSVAGMVAMSAVLSLPLHVAARRFAYADRAVRALAALFSLGFGLSMAWELGHRGGWLA